MGQNMTWSEMQQRFPDEWVAITDTKGDVQIPYGAITGRVVIHSTSETEFTQQLKREAASLPKIAIRYTGELLPDHPVGPLLWRISDTNS